VELSKQYHPPYIVIYIDEINDEVQQVIDIFTSPNPHNRRLAKKMNERIKKL
jgi:hypothetical protein